MNYNNDAKIIDVSKRTVYSVNNEPKYKSMIIMNDIVIMALLRFCLDFPFGNIVMISIFR